MTDEDLVETTQQCKHEWEMKSISKHGGTPRTLAGWQCRKCGCAKISKYDSPSGNTVYGGWDDAE